MIWPFAKPKLRVLVVCTANICRSAGAAALLRHHLRLAGLHRQVSVTSAGMRVGAPGAPPDPRVISILAEHGVLLRKHKATAFEDSRPDAMQHIWVMEHGHLSDILKSSPYFTDRAELIDPDGGEIPDPYFGDKAGVRAMLERLNDVTRRRVEQLVYEIRDGA